MSLNSTRMFNVQNIVSKKDGFAIAEGFWNNEKETSLACRYYDVTGGIGYPQTFGKPQWMLLPSDMFERLTLIKISKNNQSLAAA